MTAKLMWEQKKKNMVCSLQHSPQLISIDAVAGYKIKFFEFKNFLKNFLSMDPIQN